MPAGIYKSMGINIIQLKAILHTKLILDDRRPNTIHQTSQKKQKKPISFATFGTMLLSGFMGCFFLISFFIGNDTTTRFTIYFSFFIFVLASTLIADFTSVLIDVRDNVIILPKPVTDKTFVLARLLHILIHISKMVLPMVLPAMIYIGVQKGILQLIPFNFLVVFATLFSIFLINALYILILKLTTPERFKVIISYFQIFFAIIFYGGYQLVPRLINKAALENYTISTNSWAWLIPSYWFAGSMEFMTSLHFSFTLFTCFIFSILIPIFCIWVVIKYFAPSFNQKLSMISGSEAASAPTVNEHKKSIRTTSVYLNTITEKFTETGAERMSFLHTWKMTSRSRDFKMKVYPSLGYIVVYVFIMFFSNKGIRLSDLQDQTGSGKTIFIGLIYFSSFVLIMAISQILYSEKYKAAWIYYITPIDSPGKVISGAIKSIIVKFYLPLVTLTTLAAILMVGPRIIPNLLLGLFNQLLITCTIGYISIRAFPFAQLQNQAKSNFIRGIFSFVIPVAIALLHYVIYGMMPVVIILTVLSGIACWFMMDAIKTKNWSQIKTLYQD